MPQTGDTVTKDPDATELAKGIDWTNYCAERSTTISASTWVITGPDADLTVADDSIVTGNVKTQVKLSGGTVGRLYTLTNHITTVAGGTDDRSIYVRIDNR